MQTNHTPGPWSVKNSVFATVHNQHGERIATVGACLNESDNARLIAAAPDLLEALRDLFNSYDSGIYSRREWEAARAAIAKATGSAS